MGTMRFCLQVFCIDRKPISRREIAEFLQRTRNLETRIVFDPPPEAPESLLRDWESLVIGFHAKERGVVVTRHVGSKLFQQEIGELLNFVNACEESERQKDVQRRLQAVSQVFQIHVQPNVLATEDWVMLDKLENYLACSLNGIIYAPGEGFFNSELQQINLLLVKKVVVPIHRLQ